MNQYFDEMVTLLSIISEKAIPRKMDKVTTLKEAVSCIKIYYDLTISKSEVAPTPPSLDMPLTQQQSIKSPSSPFSTSLPTPPSTSSCHSQTSAPTYGGLLNSRDVLGFFLDSYDAFLMVVSETGRIIFTTELVTSLLGHMQSRLVGQNLFEYIHNRDKDIIRGLFTPPEDVEGQSLPNSPLLLYPSRSFTALFQLYVGETSCFPQYLPFKCVSFLRQWKPVDVSDRCPSTPTPTTHENLSEDTFTQKQMEHSYIILLGKLPTSLALLDLSISTNDVEFEFEVRVSREGRIVDIDKHAILVMGFSVAELIGTLFFEYIDPYHITDVGESMGRVINNGLGLTTPYRICTKGGRYLWVISKGYLSYNPWNNKPDHVLLANRVLGCDQVLPEHRFFRNRKQLPDLEGRECYVPNLTTNTEAKAKSSNSNAGNTHVHAGKKHSEHPLLLTASRDLTTPENEDMRTHHSREIDNQFSDSVERHSHSRETSRQHSALPVQDREQGEHHGGRGFDGARIQDRPERTSGGGGGGCGADEAAVTRVIAGGEVGMRGNGRPATAIDSVALKEHEERTKMLEEMQQKLEEKEKQLKNDQMEFYKFMRQMMQQVPLSPSPSTLSPSPSTQEDKDESSLMGVMGKFKQGPASQPMAVPLQYSMPTESVTRMGRSDMAAATEDNPYESWREQVPEMEFGQYQQQQQSLISTLNNSYPNFSSVTSMIPSCHTQRQNQPSEQFAQGFSSPISTPTQNTTQTFDHSNPSYSLSNLPRNSSPLVRNSQGNMLPERGGGSYGQSHLNLPATQPSTMSLADHNMQFYQHHEQQQIMTGRNDRFTPTASLGERQRRGGNMVRADLFSPSMPPEPCTLNQSRPSPFPP